MWHWRECRAGVGLHIGNACAVLRCWLRGCGRHREVRVFAAWAGPPVSRALHHLVGNGRDGRVHGHLGARLHGAERGLYAYLNCLAHQLLHLGIAHALLDVQLAHLEFVQQFGLDLGANLLWIGLTACLCHADSLDHLLFARQVHQVDHKRHHHLLHVRRQRLDGLGQRVELLRAEAAGAWHILQRHLDSGAQHIVAQVLQPGIWVHLWAIQHHRARWVQHIALDHHHLFLAAHVLDFQRKQQLAHHRARLLELVHQVGHADMRLLYLRLFLHAGARRALLALKCRGDRAHARDSSAAVLHQLELLAVELEVRLDLEARARVVAEVVGIKDHVGIGPGNHASKLLVTHSHGALGALRAAR